MGLDESIVWASADVTKARKRERMERPCSRRKVGGKERRLSEGLKRFPASASFLPLPCLSSEPFLDPPSLLCPFSPSPFSQLFEKTYIFHRPFLRCLFCQSRNARQR